MITKELLNEAGWECVEVGDNGPATPKEHRNRYEVWSPNRIRIIYDRKDDKWSYDGKTITNLSETPWPCTSNNIHMNDLRPGDLLRHKSGNYATVERVVADMINIVNGAIPSSWIKNWEFIRHGEI